MALQSSWDNTTLFVDDDPADRAFRQEVRDWITQNLPVELCNRSTRIDPPELKPWHRKLYERGWIAPHWPKDHGGMGATLDPADHPVRGDQPGRRAHALSARPQLHRALDHRRRNGGAEGEAPAADPHRRDHVVPGLFRSGRRIGPCEPATRAELDGEEFIVNGHKMWTTNGHFADWMFALVRTDPRRSRVMPGSACC